MEAYGVAGYEMPQTLLLNYSYELPFGRGRQFMSGGDSFGYKVLNQVIGGWNIAGVTTWNPKGTPVLVPDVPSQASGARLYREQRSATLAPGVKIKTSRNYTKALVTRMREILSLRITTKVLNPDAFVTTPDFSLANSPFVFPNVRNPGSVFTDATLLKKFPIADEGATVLRASSRGSEHLQPCQFRQIDNNPTDPTFGGVLGKTGQRIMQIGARIFF